MRWRLSRPHKHPRSKNPWFRKVVPERLRERAGRTEIKISLGTDDPAEAQLRNAQLEVEWRNRFAGWDREIADAAQLQASRIVEDALRDASGADVFDELEARDRNVYAHLKLVAFTVLSGWGWREWIERRADLLFGGFVPEEQFDEIEGADLIPADERDQLVAFMRAMEAVYETRGMGFREVAIRVLKARRFDFVTAAVLGIAARARIELPTDGLLGDAIADALLRAIVSHRLSHWSTTAETMFLPMSTSALPPVRAEEPPSGSTILASGFKAAPAQAVGEVDGNGGAARGTDGAAAADLPAGSVIRLSEALAIWAEQARPREQSVLEATRAVDRFIELYGDLPCSAITKPMVIGFRDFLQKLPAGLQLDKIKAKGGSLRDAAESKRTSKSWNRKLLSPGTVKKDIGALSAILNTLKHDSKLEVNVAGEVRVAGYSKTRKGQVNPRLPLRTSHLLTLFASPLFTGCEGLAEIQRTRPGPHVYQDALYWAFLLGPTSGMRLEEIGQILVDDIEVLDVAGERYALIHVTGTGEDQHVKTEESARIIMVHPNVVDLGFIDLVDRRRSAGAKRLFELTQNKIGKWTKELSRDVNLYIDRVVTNDPRYVWYSTRHSFSDVARSAGVDADTRRRLMGHASSSVHEGYGLGASLKKIADELQKLDLSFIDWERLRKAAGRK